MQFYDLIEETRIDDIIIEERNRDVKQINEDMEHISDIFYDLSELVCYQGEEISTVEKTIQSSEINVSQSIKNLADAEDMNWKRNAIMRDLAIIVGGIGLGACGFIAGPLIGLGTLVSGAGVGGGIVYANHKLE